MEKLDLKVLGLRALNEKLQSQSESTNQKQWEVINPGAATPWRWGSMHLSMSPCGGQPGITVLG